MSFEIVGKLIEKFEIQEITPSFKKREFVIEKSETSGEKTFTEFIKFQLSQDKCELIDQYQLNEDIKVHFNIKGRKWEKDGRSGYFVNLEVWRIENTSQVQEKEPTPQDDIDNIPPEMEDDLPF